MPCRLRLGSTTSLVCSLQVIHFTKQLTFNPQSPLVDLNNLKKTNFEESVIFENKN